MERVELDTILPPEPLRPFVRRYLYANRPLDAPVTFRASPTGYAYLTHFFGPPGNERGRIDGRTFKRVTRWFLFGQITDHDVRFHHGKSLRLIVAEMAATAPYRMFGISGERILGLGLPLDEAAPAAMPLARSCFRLGAGASRAEHVAEANAFFGALAARALRADPAVEEAVRLLEASDGAVRIADLCARLDIEARPLNRRFRRLVGVSPKFFGRVMQINRVVDLLYSRGEAELARTAQEAGFYDQPHFNHAMKHFFREGPRAFLRADHHALRSFLAGSRRCGANASGTADWPASREGTEARSDAPEDVVRQTE